MPPPRKPTLATALLATVLASGCVTATQDPAAPDRPSNVAARPVAVEPLATPLAALPGAVVMVSLELEGAPSTADQPAPAFPIAVPDRRLQAVLASSGEALDTLTLALFAAPDNTTATDAADWLGQRLRVEARTAEAVNAQAGARPPLAWLATIELPSDIPAGRDAIRIADRSIPITIVTASKPASLPPNDADAPPRDYTRAELDALLTRLAPAIANPTQHWRLRLIEQHRPSLLRGELTARLDAAQATQTPASRSLATAINDRWQTAIHRLHRAQPEAADALKSRLTAVAQLHTRELVPAWPPADDALNDLLRVLTLPSADDARLIDRVDLELRRHPPVALWVLDDAGASFSLSRPREDTGPLEPGFDPAQSPFSFARPAPARAVRQVAVAATELRGRTILASVSSAGLSGAVGIPLQPHTTATRLVDVAAPTDTRTAEVEARVGPARVRRASPAIPLIAAPPALRLGPLAEEFTHRSWWSATPALPPRSYRTAASLYHTDDLWTLYIEAHRPPAQPNATQTPGPDSIRVYTGQFQSGATPITITPPPLGETSAFTTPLGFDVRVTADPDVWRAWINFPESAERAEEFLLGLTRVDPRNARTAWPRPLVPGQTEPGRRRIRLDTWRNPDTEFTAHRSITRPGAADGPD